MESLSEHLDIHTNRDYARCAIGLINLFMDNPIPMNENIISIFEERIKNGTLQNIFTQHNMKCTFDGCCVNIR